MCDKRYTISTRREFVAGGVGTAAVMLGLHRNTRVGSRVGPAGSVPLRSNLETAISVARWLEAARIETEYGVTWPADPADHSSVGTTLYSHSPGVVLFLLELFHATGESDYLSTACSGADHLIGQGIEADDVGTGLYTGTAGILFCLTEAFRASGRREYGEACERILANIRRSARPVGAGVTWSPVTDIISGSAGTGLTLLYANTVFPNPDSIGVAAGAGRFLLELARPDSGGLKWPMAEDYPRLMPNFSHGTAGVAYFLASLYEATGDRAFLDSAIAGARYLQAVARLDGETFAVFHNEPDGLDLYYLSWCHGPPGTARLYYKLAEITGDDTWLAWVHRAAAAIIQSGIPEQQTPGFWNNVSQCCGHVGVGELMLALCRLGYENRYRAFERRLTADLIRRARENESGLSWVQAEHRTRPELLVAQTGYMQGAAGIGSYFLHIDALERGEGPFFRFPDAPY